MKRGDVYLARLDPTEGSEQAGTRPIAIVSRDAINQASPVILAVPCTTHRAGRRLYPSQVLVKARDGGLKADSIALGEQVRAVAKTRLLKRLGSLSRDALRGIDLALSIALDLPSQDLA